MIQMARNLPMDEWGLVKLGYYLICDGDKKFCHAYNDILDHADIAAQVTQFECHRGALGEL